MRASSLSHLSLGSLPLGLALAGVVGWSACGGVGAPSSFPDNDKVVVAQQKWCETLARLHGDDWASDQSCAAAVPTGSAPFIKMMSDCYVEQVEEIAEHSVGTEALRRACTDMVLESADPGDVSETAVISARCQRMQRCEEVPTQRCLESFQQLTTTQRSGLTAMYNLRAQRIVAQCLDDMPCGGNEDKVHADCYDAVFSDRVWVPSK